MSEKNNKQLLETVQEQLNTAMREIHDGHAEKAREILLTKVLSRFIKQEAFALEHGDLFDRAIGLAAVCLELAPTEETMKLLSGAIQIRLEQVKSTEIH